MRILVFIAKIIDKTVSILSTIFIIILLLYSGFSIWNTHMIMNNGVVDEELLKYKPGNKEDNSDGDDELQKKINQDALIEINKDYQSWITIFDTSIDYPVVQGKDNLEYVNKDFCGKFSVSGVPFLDHRNSAYFQDNYNLLYGHNIENEVMFGDVAKFLDEDFFNQHLMGELYTLDKEYDIYLFASFETYASDEYVFIPGNLKEQQMQNFLEYIKSKAVVYKDVKVNTKSKLICLSTCSNYYKNKRIVLFGKLVER